VAQLLGLFAILWGTGVIVVSLLSASGRIPATSINGMRRRRASESDAAWAAGQRAYLPWVLSYAVMLIIAGIASIFLPENIAFITLATAAAAALLLGGPIGIAALDRAVTRAQND